MGFKTEHNYIVKVNDNEVIKGLKPGDYFRVVKEGTRLFMMDCPLYLADADWNIIGKCFVNVQTTAQNETFLECCLLFMFTKEESILITKLNRIGENELAKTKQRLNPQCPISKEASEIITKAFIIPDEDSELHSTEYFLPLRNHNLTVAFLHNGTINMQGVYNGALRETGNVHSEHNNIWLNEQGEIETDIRHVVFQLSDGTKGIAFNTFDLVD